MQFLILFACALAAASAGFVAPIHSAPQHLPVIGHNGVPVDTAAVQQATAEHLNHKVEAHVRNGDFAPVYAHTPVVAGVAHHGVVAASPVFAQHAGAAHHGVVAAAPFVGHGPAAYPTTAVHPTSVNGVPLETPEVVAATADHFAAHAEANARVGYPSFAYSGASAYPVAAHSAYSAYPYAGHSAYPYAGHSAYPYAGHSAYPYAGHSAALYRHRRGVVAPFAYSGYGHAAYAATPYSAYPYAGYSAAHLYRARRGVVAPFAYSGYAHTPVVAAHSTYSAYPHTYGQYSHYY